MFLELLSKKQSDRYHNWLFSRPPRREGCSGGRYTWHLTPTTLGTVIKVTDNSTKEEIDLSDYETW